MKFQVKLFPLKTEKLSVILNSADADELGLLPGDRVKVSLGRDTFVAEVEVATEMVNPGEVGVCTTTANLYKIAEPCSIELTPVPKPKSVEYIRKKLDGLKYSKNEIKDVISDISKNILNDIEIAAFVLASDIIGLDLDEIQWMTEAMVECGDKITFERGTIVDTHSIGGVPGNRASLIIVPTVAAAGLLIPKTASRAITSASGTADTMEVLANVNLSIDEIREITERVGGVIAWSAGANIAPADELIIKIEYQIEASPIPHLFASLLAKKVGSGSKYVAIDIPIGDKAKINSIDFGRSFASSFIELGRRLGLKVSATLSDGSQPICNGVGPALEAKEILKLMERCEVRNDVVEKSLSIAGILFEMTGVATDGYGYAKKIFESGKSLEKFKEIIEAQGGDGSIKSDDIQIGDKTYTLRSNHQGAVIAVNNKSIVKIARAAGAPKDKGSGVYVHRKRGEIVRAGDPLLTIYAEKEWKLDNAVEIAHRKQPIDVSGVIIEKVPFRGW